MRAVPFEPATGRAGPARNVFEGSFVEDPCGVADFDVAANGDRFAMIRRIPRPPTLRIIFDELFERLRRAAPGN